MAHNHKTYVLHHYSAGRVLQDNSGLSKGPPPFPPKMFFGQTVNPISTRQILPTAVLRAPPDVQISRRPWNCKVYSKRQISRTIRLKEYVKVWNSQFYNRFFIQGGIFQKSCPNTFVNLSKCPLRSTEIAENRNWLTWNKSLKGFPFLETYVIANPTARI